MPPSALQCSPEIPCVAPVLPQCFAHCSKDQSSSTKCTNAPETVQTVIGNQAEPRRHHVVGQESRRGLCCMGQHLSPNHPPSIIQPSSSNRRPRQRTSVNPSLKELQAPLSFPTRLCSPIITRPIFLRIADDAGKPLSGEINIGAGARFKGNGVSVGAGDCLGDTPWRVWHTGGHGIVCVKTIAPSYIVYLRTPPTTCHTIRGWLRCIGAEKLVSYAMDSVACDAVREFSLLEYPRDGV